MSYKPEEYAKATVGAILAGLTALGTALADTEGIDDWEWVGIAAAVVATFGTVFGTPNAAHPQHRRVQRPEGGDAWPPLLQFVAMVLGVLLIIWVLIQILSRV